jgi:hypothetical protein
MAGGDLAGWLAAALTLVAFSMRSMGPLRVAAIAANLCFIVCGALGGLYPAVALHTLLLPCNVVRLCQLQPRDAPTARLRPPPPSPPPVPPPRSATRPAPRPTAPA